MVGRWSVLVGVLEALLCACPTELGFVSFLKPFSMSSFFFVVPGGLLDNGVIVGYGGFGGVPWDFPQVLGG